MRRILYSELKKAWDAEDVGYFIQVSEIDRRDNTVYYYMDALHLWIKRRVNQWEEISGRRILSPFLCALLNKKYKLAQIFEDDFDDDYFGELKIFKYLAFPWYQEQLDWIKANTTLFRNNGDFWRRLEAICKKYAELYDWDDECFFDKKSQKADFLD